MVTLKTSLVKVRQKFGIPWWIWSAFIIFAQFINNASAGSDLITKILNSILALFIFVFIPWAIRNRFKRRRSEKPSRKAEAARKKAERAARDTLHKLLDYGIWINSILAIYALFMFLSLYIREMTEYIKELETDDLSLAFSQPIERFFELLISSADGRFLIVIFVWSIAYRITRAIILRKRSS